MSVTDLANDYFSAQLLPYSHFRAMLVRSCAYTTRRMPTRTPMRMPRSVPMLSADSMFGGMMATASGITSAPSSEVSRRPLNSFFTSAE